MKKCVTCRVPIEQFVPQIVCRGGKRQLQENFQIVCKFLSIFLFCPATKRRRSSGKMSGSLSRDEVAVMGQQLQELKEKVWLNEGFGLGDNRD